MIIRGLGDSQLNSSKKNFEADVQKSTVELGDMPLSSIGVIQSLCNGDPDNDLIFCMTRPVSTNFTFDRSINSMPLLIPFNKYSPYNAQATTHLHSAFWGLYLPITVPGHVTDIWRSYLTQRIMKDIGLHVLYTPPIVHHNRSEHDYISNFSAERDLYAKTANLLQYLNGWSSDASTLPERIIELWVGLYEHDYIGHNDVHGAREWLNTLLQMGYKFPPILAKSSNIASTEISTSSIQVQPTQEGQVYRALPKNGEFPNIPGSAVVKLIMMTMDEWPLLKSWVLVSACIAVCPVYYHHI